MFPATMLGTVDRTRVGDVQGLDLPGQLDRRLVTSGQDVLG